MTTHEYYVKHREELLSKRKKYRQEHLEHEKQTRHNYYMVNREAQIKSAVEWRRNNPERFRQTQNERLKNHPEKRAEIRQKYRMRNPEKYHARNVARSIPRAEQCEFCFSTEKLEHHHPDYLYPHIFVTACKECHIYIDENKGGRPIVIFDSGVTNTDEAKK